MARCVQPLGITMKSIPASAAAQALRQPGEGFVTNTSRIYPGRATLLFSSAACLGQIHDGAFDN